MGIFLTTENKWPSLGYFPKQWSRAWSRPGNRERKLPTRHSIGRWVFFQFSNCIPNRRSYRLRCHCRCRRAAQKLVEILRRDAGQESESFDDINGPMHYENVAYNCFGIQRG
ncbi:hypothetical protein EVAR_67121_1 [Eumeta japonica]|uniref:Uncharacterized protein n=1 Tax=Eumeta variegata TaxID=151549 RepID=A0A4C1ZZ04_EUMVA|nr:hypothetical protein EVAR_67121_1 [Eumeta japonica]